ncbi:MAG: DUF6880 family protein [Alphaproteobacteria bacterium]
MAPRIKLDAKALEALGAKQLAKLLMEISDCDPVLTRRLRMALAARQGGGGRCHVNVSFLIFALISWNENFYLSSTPVS